MQKIRFGSNVAVFFLFFGIAALDAIQTRAWPRVAFWLLIGVVFLLADSRRIRR